jgi:hypothetical protein
MSSNGREEILRIAPVVMIAAPRLVLRLLIAYLRFMGRADRASAQLRKSMVDEGVPRELAGSIARDFRDQTNLWNLVTRLSRR